MRIRDEDDDDAPEVNLAPLIDCIFLLLIFFLLTSTVKKNDDDKLKAVQQLTIELPEAAAASTSSAETEPLVISVNESGKMSVAGQRVTLEQLHRKLREAAPNRPKIRLEGDRRAAFEHIAHVIDLCHFEGLHEIAVRTRDE